MIQLSYPPPEWFLKAETKCNYYISEEMKEIWAVELDLAQKLLEVCKKYNLKIFADWGTSLGAVRHNGFIPWDDDMDFSMPRVDYEKLRKIAKKEFEFPYYFCAGDDADGFLISGYAKLRNSNTTAIFKDDKKRKMKCNQGIFIDIYPLDNVPDNEVSFVLQKKIARISIVMACGFAFFSTRFFEPSNLFVRIFAKILHKTFRKPSKVLMQLCLGFHLKTIQRYNNIKTTRVMSYFTLNFNPRERSIFDTIIEIPFEHIRLPIALNYDASLRALYGDYMVLKKNASLHEGTFYDAKRSYTEYV